MKLLTQQTIDGKSVSQVGTISDLQFWENIDNNSEYPRYYVLRDGVVLGDIQVSCSMGQGTGYVEDISFNSFVPATSLDI